MVALPTGAIWSWKTISAAERMPDSREAATKAIGARVADRLAIRYEAVAVRSGAPPRARIAAMSGVLHHSAGEGLRRRALSGRNAATPRRGGWGDGRTMRRSFSCVLLGLALAAFAPEARAAGLFDAITSIFGADPRPVSPRAFSRPYGIYGDSEPLDVTVRGRPGRGRARAVSADAPGQKPLNTSIDPEKVPDWYLRDPTLRRGDILVLKNRVLVVDGGASPGRLGLTPLDQSRLVSRAERQKVRAMAGLAADRPAPEPGRAAKTRTAAQAIE